MNYFNALGIFFATAMACGSVGAQIKPDPSAQHRTVADVLVLLDQVKPDPERVEAYRSQLKKPLPAEDALWLTKRDALLERMDAAESLGQIKERLDSANALIALFRSRNDKAREIEFAASYINILNDSGRVKEANAVRDEAMRFSGTRDSWLIGFEYQNVRVYANAGDMQSAATLYQQATTRYQSYNGYAANYLISQAHHWATAALRRAQGRNLEAQTAYALALKDTQSWMDYTNNKSRNIGKQALPSNVANSTYLRVRLDYASFLLDTGRLREAEEVARQPLLWALSYVGKYSPLAIRSAASYAEILSGQGRFVEAEKLALTALEMARGIGAEEDSSYAVAARYALGRAYLGQGQATQADALFSLDSRYQGNETNAIAGIAAVLSGRAEQVLTALKIQSERAIANLGAEHPLTWESRAVYAMALATNAEKSRQLMALAEFNAALPALIAIRKQASDFEDQLRLKMRRWTLQSYLSVLSNQGVQDNSSLNKSFQLAELLRDSNTQQAVSANTARASVSEPALVAAVRREQDLRLELIHSNRILQRFSTLSVEQINESGENPAIVKSRIEAVTREHSTLFADIEKRFPKYANLIDPKPPTLEQTRAALRPGEVLLSVLTTPERSFVWAVPHTGAIAFHASALGETGIAPIVKRLRSALDVGNLEASRWPAIDVAGAHQIYRELLQPVQATFGGAHTLIMTANNSLASLPPAVLVTTPTTLGKDKAVPFDRYLDVPWLDKQMATAQLPSVNALVSLRAAAPASAQRKAFAGFGDPVFAANAPINAANAANAAPAATRGTGLRSAPTERLTEQTMREGKAVAWQPYSKLAPLPDTRDEVTAIAKALGADVAKDVVFGAQVTRQRVKQTDLSATRIVAFATHGLMAGDFPGLSQPALALSAPAGKDADKEPLEALLTLEDVLQLKMDADWVVLSACNTAAADGQGSEAVSGLGRGFFYAGSRALLVTHWSVDSESAKDLVSHTFTRYAQDPQITRAKALQAAMQHIRASTAKDPVSQASYSLAHPLFWAPYALVGEPGR
jgi:CHAT domain-containing protein